MVAMNAQLEIIVLQVVQRRFNVQQVLIDQLPLENPFQIAIVAPMDLITLN